MSILTESTGFQIKLEKEVTKPAEGFRNVFARWKTNKETNIKPDTKAVCVACITDGLIKENLTVLLPFFRSYLESVQDAIFKAMLEESYSKAFVVAEEIGIPAIVDFLNTSSESGRMTKESVGIWFDSAITENLMVILANKWGISDNPSKEEEARVFAVVKAYREKVSSLAGTKTHFNTKEKAQILKCLELAKEDDFLAKKFIQRVQGMDDKAVELLEAL